MGICTPYVDSDLGRVTVHTSATRPTGLALYAGKYIFETDTGRTLMYDGTGWVIMNEPIQSFTPTVTASSGVLTTVSGAWRYTRSDGWLNFGITITITTNGTGAGAIQTTVPVGFDSSSSAFLTFGHGRENALTGSTLQVTAAGALGVIFTYNNAYPGGTGAVLNLSGRYRMITRYS